jgi:epsilon-lactone hydrolase
MWISNFSLINQEQRKMKPSAQSYFFRLFSKALAAYLASKPGVEQWRKISNPSMKPAVPRAVQLQQIKIGNIPAEWLIPAQAEDAEKTILYFHGGAWLFGWYNTHRMLVGHIAKQTRIQALAVDYRLAPEFPFPAALDDCLAAYHYLLDRGIRSDQVIMAGDSAGGNLVITCMLALRDAGEPLPAAGVCISPATDLTAGGVSNNANKNKDAILSSGLYSKFANILQDSYTGSHDLSDPLLSPIFADLYGLPALLVQAGEDEILLKSITAFVNKARQEGVQVTYEVWPAMWHVFQIYTPYLPEARFAVYSLSRYIEDKLS